jgi:hypothetical protein
VRYVVLFRKRWRAVVLQPSPEVVGGFIGGGGGGFIMVAAVVRWLRMRLMSELSLRSPDAVSLQCGPLKRHLPTYSSFDTSNTMKTY